MTNGILRAAPAALLGALLVSGCGGTSRSDVAGSSAASALSTAYASTAESTGTLLCAPSQAQIEACATLAAGDTCTLTGADGSTTIDGTCRATLDGASVACAPNPPAPPQPLVDACSGKVLGDACSVSEPFGGERTGACVTARDGATLVCGRVHTPPQVAIDACATLAAGDACTMASPRAATETVTGVCSMGPASTGPLACAPAQELLPRGTQACAGLAAGAACGLGRDGHGASGSCVTPAAGGDAVCVVACADLGGRFDCRPPRGGGPRPHGH